jgi:hypothetical protein
MSAPTVPLGALIVGKRTLRKPDQLCVGSPLPSNAGAAAR